MGRLTTHVLDTAHGRPGQGIAVTLFRLDGGRRELLRTVTNDDGRCDRPLLEGEAFEAGTYELVFAAGDYFRALGGTLPGPPFVGEVGLRFGVGAHEAGRCRTVDTTTDGPAPGTATGWGSMTRSGSAAWSMRFQSSRKNSKSSSGMG